VICARGAGMLTLEPLLMRICEELAVPHVLPGASLKRAALNEESAAGAAILQCQEQGEEPPPALEARAVCQDLLTRSNGWLLADFPGSMEQIGVLDAHQIRPTRVVCLHYDATEEQDDVVAEVGAICSALEQGYPELFVDVPTQGKMAATIFSEAVVAIRTGRPPDKVSALRLFAPAVDCTEVALPNLVEMYSTECQAAHSNPNLGVAQQLQQLSNGGVTLDFTRNYIGDRGLAIVLRVLKGRAHSLETLLLAHNGLRNRSIGSLVQALAGSAQVRVIDLRYNRICDKGAARLLELVQSCPKLVTLDVRFNDMALHREMDVMGAVTPAQDIASSPDTTTIS